MIVCVLGLTHLGAITAASLADSGFQVVGLDDDTIRVENLRRGVPPIFEPGLNELTVRALSTGRLRFTTDGRSAVRDAELVWVAFDTPVDDEDRADVAFVTDRIEAIFPDLKDGAVVLISSQLPVGSTRRIEERFATQADGRSVSFAYAPENLRLGQAVADFKAPPRLVVGVRDERARQVVTAVCGGFTTELMWMSIESAEMTKHALNAFLAGSVALTNEVARLCERLGADARDVERALRTDVRIGPRAYVRAGGALAGGTLARDIVFLSDLGEEADVPLPVVAGIRASNADHRAWPIRTLRAEIGSPAGKTVAVLGLAYKAGTDSLRRSQAVEMCRWLLAEGAQVNAYDPKVATLPDDLEGSVRRHPTPAAATRGADAVVVATEWPEFKALAPNDVAGRGRVVVVDQYRFLDESFTTDDRLRYVAFGRSN